MPTGGDAASQRLITAAATPSAIFANNQLQQYRIATMNLATVRAPHKLAMFRDTIYSADVDIALLQEVYVADFLVPTGYTGYVSHASDTGSGVAILLRDGIPAEDIVYLHTARGMAITVFGVRIINIYAPSGSSRRQDRNTFFAEEVTPLFTGPQDDLILGGDFNSTQGPTDQLPRHSPCAALSVVIDRLRLVDTWTKLHGTRPGFTFYTAHSASRLDRIYLTRHLADGTRHAEVWPLAFSDHEAYICDVTLARQRVWHSRGLWKLNVSHLTAPDCRHRIENAWAQCLRRREAYDSTLSWWLSCAKPTLRKTLMSYGREVKAWRTSTLNFYYSILRDCVTMPFSPDRQTMVHRTKAQISLIMRRHLEGTVIRSRTCDRIAQEQPSMYHLLQERQRRRRSLIHVLIDAEGRRLDTQHAIGQALHSHFTRLYAAVPHSADLISEVAQLTPSTLPVEVVRELQEEVTMDEVLEAIKLGSNNKSPGPDGIPIEFYKSFQDLLAPTWTTIAQELMSPTTAVPNTFLDGIIIPIHKPHGLSRIEDYRPITLLNSDMKIFTRLLASRLKKVARYVISCDQTSLGGDNNIHTALCRYRDMIALAHYQRLPGALASLDFSQAFDRVDHSYLQTVLQHMGFPGGIVTVIMRLLNGANSKIMYNGRLTPPLVITRSVRQGCPLSTILYAFALEPLLQGLRQRLEGMTLHGNRFCCTAYADDLVLYLRSENDVRAALTWVATYGEASGSSLNVSKSKVLLIGEGLPEESVAPLSVAATVRCLGIDFSADLRRSAAINGRRLLQTIRASLADHRLRSLNIIQRAQYVNIYHASRIPHVARVLPIPTVLARRMLAALGSYVSSGMIFKVQYDSLTLPRERGGVGLTHVPTRVTALYVSSQLKIWRHCPQSLTGLLLSAFTPDSLVAPITISNIPVTFYHIRRLFLDLSYVYQSLPLARLSQTKTMYDLLQQCRPPNPIEIKYPQYAWRHIWKAVHARFLESDVQSAWYITVNGKQVNRHRLHRIHLADSPLCIHCGVDDTDAHRFECGQANDVWTLARRILAFLTRQTPAQIDINTLLFPGETFYPTTKTHSVNWIRGHTIRYLFDSGEKTVQEYWNFLNERHCVLTCNPRYQQYFSNFLRSAFQDPPRSWNVQAMRR